MKRNNLLLQTYSKKLFSLTSILFTVFLCIFSNNIVYAENTNINSKIQSSSTHERSVQKLYAKVYDQDTDKYLGRFLLATQVGYKNSPHRMFDADGINPVHIDGYAFVGSPSAMIPVNWKNKSGVTEIKWTMVKTNSETYKKTQQAIDNIKNNENSNKTANPKLNEDGLQVDDEGNVNLHDLYHSYMSFLGHPLPSDRAGYNPSSHALYLFQKYLGYDPNKTKEENYKHSTNYQSSLNKSTSSYSNASRSNSSKKTTHNSSTKKATRNIKHSTKKDKKKPKLNSSLKPTLLGMSLGLIGFLIFLIIKRLKLK